MFSKLLPVLIVCLFPQFASAGVDVPPEFLSGRYRLLMEEDGSASLDLLWITIEGDQLRIESCVSGQGVLARAEGPERLVYQRGSFGDRTIGCEVFVNMGNYPILVCWDSNDARLAAFPEADKFGARPDCFP